MESYPFLRGGGETGELIRNFDWQNTTVGLPDEWPQSLQTICGVMLHSALPIMIWWGKDSIQFYNDAYVKHFHSDSKYHAALGQPVEIAWPETWPAIKPMIDSVLESSEPTNSEACIFTYKDGKPEDVSWTFNYSAVLDASGHPAGVLVTCTECDTRDLEANTQQLHLAIEASQLATWELNPNTHVFTASTRLKEWFGLPLDNTFEYTAAVNAIPEKDRKRVADAIAYALTWESGGHYEIEHRIINPKTGIERIVRAIGLTQFDENKQPLRFNGTIQDITAERITSTALQESQNTLLALFDKSPIAIATVSGDDLIIESANAFYAELVGRKPKDFIGLPMMDAMPELKGQGFGKLMRNVMHTGVPYIKDEVPVNILRKDKIATIYINLTYKKRESLEGKDPSIVFVATDVTQQVLTRKVIEESETKFRSLIEGTPVATCLFSGPEHIIELANETMIQVWGKGQSVIGKPLEIALPELKGQPFLPLLHKIFTTGISHETKGGRADLFINGALQTFYFDYAFKPLYNIAGEIYAIMETAVDVTAEVTSRIEIEESERNLLSLFEESPVGIATMSADDALVFKSANEFYGLLVGRKPQDIIGKQLLDALPELKDQGFDRILKNVIKTGEAFIADEVRVEIIRSGKMDTIYVNLTYQPRHKSDGGVSGVLVVATDVTQQVLTRNEIEASERKLRAVIAAAPAGIGLFVGRDLIIENPNQTFIDIIGKGPNIVGLPLREAMPELLAEGQPFLKILDDVFTTGVAFISPASLVKIVQHGVLNDNYYNISYTPVFDSGGKVYAILDIAIDVTAQIHAQQKLEEAEANMRGAVELAQLGTWSIDVATNGLTYSDRLIEWFGHDPSAENYIEVIPIIQEEDQERIAAAVARALKQESGGIYDEIYTIIHPRTGKKKILHAHGKTVFDIEGKPVRMNGTAQDITIQMELQFALEGQVLERTEELAAINEELQAMNEELSESNSRLIHSNEELAQYAYVASHDLQEPLRKIRVFSSMLSQQKTLSEENKPIVNKINQSAERMTLLIKDLLNFSRLVNSDSVVRAVNLNDILKDIITDFELTVAEKNATITIESLPVIEGVGLQMNQLFYNLISNALKFSREGVPPIITIGSKELNQGELLQHIPNPQTGSTYFEISVSDNGIGFEGEYSEKIFEVFKRLHTKELYPGSGIGLALCKRIVTMHGGALYSDSDTGVGSVFHIILHN